MDEGNPNRSRSGVLENVGQRFACHLIDHKLGTWFGSDRRIEICHEVDSGFAAQVLDKERERVDKPSMANRRSPKIADDIAQFLDRFLAGFEQSRNIVIKVQQATAPQILP